MSDADLRAGVEAALGRVPGPIARRPWERSSSAPLELVSGDGFGPWLLKDLGATSRPSLVVDAGREREAYAVLPAGLCAPRCYAAGRDWLLLELVHGAPLSEASRLDAWEAAARWLARLHATPIPRARRLLRHDEAHLLRWLARAEALAPAGSLTAVAPAARAAAARLAALPTVLVHGEAYASNLLVEEARIRPVDWETIGTGPAVLDLAALASGDWEPSERERVIGAYREAAAGGPSETDLEAARLMVALQWLGWSASWSPPPEQRHDWLAAAVRAAEALSR